MGEREELAKPGRRISTARGSSPGSKKLKALEKRPFDLYPSLKEEEKQRRGRK